MKKIRRLSDTLINLISAGEVIERPASVVKELVENSLDAGSSEITVELEHGGRKSITVRDNGSGMNKHDLLLSVERHATSKIGERADLETLSTLGFRGEALPSIAAVSHFTITSSIDGGEAWELTIDGGVLSNISIASRTRGTTVSVAGLFYNQPARRKFLRRQTTELAWVEQYITALAMSRLDVSFRLVHNAKNVFKLLASDSVADRLVSRYRLASEAKYIIAEGISGNVTVMLTWFPDVRWSKRRHQYFLVNGRNVYSGIIQAPIDMAIAGPAGYPLLVCKVNIPADEVDVNVHPAKREVRFREPSNVRAAVENALAEIIGLRRSSFLSSHSDSAPSDGSGYTNISRYSAENDGYTMALDLQTPSNSDYTHETGSVHSTVTQFGKTYLAMETDTGLAFIDQHAAHERILYEDVLKRMQDSNESGHQRLLLPENVRLDADDIPLLETNRLLLEHAGFEFSIEDDTLIVTGVPQGTCHGIKAILEIIKSLNDPEKEDISINEQVAAAVACAGAVKAGDPLSHTEAVHLIDQLFSTGDPFHCPHGRPTIIEIPFSELEERFGRL